MKEQEWEREEEECLNYKYTCNDYTVTVYMTTCKITYIYKVERKLHHQVYKRNYTPKIDKHR